MTKEFCENWSITHKESYYWLTQRPLHSLLLIAPALLFFHIGAFIWGIDLIVPKKISQMLNYVGAPATLFPAIVISVVLLVQHASHKFSWKIYPSTLIFMLLEAAVWTIPLVAISTVSGKPMAGANLSAMQKIMQSAGAGIYEEFIFRMGIISFLLVIMLDLLKLPKGRCGVIAIIISACVFALCHFIGGSGTLAERIHWPRFFFLAIAGVTWGVAYMMRGLGVAIWSHIIWDLYYHAAST